MILIAALILSVPTHPVKVAVLDIATKSGFDADRRDVIVEFLQGELRGRGLDVVGRSDIEALLGLQKMKDALSCDSASCLAEVGGALGVNELVTGQVARMSGYLTITLKRISPKTSKVSAQVMRKLLDQSEDAILDALPALCDELYPEWPRQMVQEKPPPVVQRLRLIVESADESYGVSVVDPAGNAFQCPTAVTFVTPCDLAVPQGSARVIVTGLFEAKIEVPFGQSVYRVKYRSRRAAWTFGIMGPLLVGSAIPVLVAVDNDVMVGISAALLIVGATELLLGLPLAIVFSGNLSQFVDSPALKALTRTSVSVMPSFDARGAVSGVTSSFVLRF